MSKMVSLLSILYTFFNFVYFKSIGRKNMPAFYQLGKKYAFPPFFIPVQSFFPPTYYLGIFLGSNRKIYTSVQIKKRHSLFPISYDILDFLCRMKSSEDVIALFITKYIKTETTMVWVQIGWVGRGRKIILLFIHSFSFFHLLLYVFYSSIPFVLVRFPFPIILFKSHTCFIFRELLKVKAIIKVENITLYVMSPFLPIFNVEIS